ncbi:MAG TPA: glycoside hydrolase family 97 protein [Pyrinomonadaceae bacterium]|nr:glycoside hydrolase family 97 protein [Pyrinomonadaceae bacterium]
MKKFTLFWLILGFISLNVLAQNHVLHSPDGKTEVRLRIADKVYYSILFNQKVVVAESPISISIKENPAIGVNPKEAKQNMRTVNQNVIPIVPQKRKQIKDNFNELQITFAGGYGLIWRVYDNGAAYRWTTDLPNQITISTEQSEINLNPQDVVYYPQEDGFYSHNERKYIKYKPNELTGKLASLPALVATESGIKLWLSEADLYDYAGMWLQGFDGKGLKAVFPNYPLKEEAIKDRDIKVTEKADYIAQTTGKRQFPWRVFGLAERDADLLNNQIVYLLSEDTNENYAWVKPGKVPWDWWNANNIYGVDFKSGVNTETYKYYIDFAAKYGLEYLILDEGWSKTDDLLTVDPNINLQELLDYGKKKNVGLVLWVLWTSLDKDLVKVLDQFEKWGVKGIKVDFMQRDDQKVVNFYEKVAREAAKRKMLVDFHGAYKPTGMERKYPNVISREGVKGLENSKWSKDVTPEHDVTLPFIRMVAGPMDFTPGAMLNGGEKDFKIDFNRPMSQGTRCHQLAMYVIYESPLQMLADNPSNYIREPEAMEFLSAVPTVWDETIAIDGKVGEYLVMARQKGADWYLGAMTNWTPRELTIDLSFLGNGNYEANIIQDGMNANRFASDFKKVKQLVKKGDKLTFKMAAGGGYVVRFIKK